MGVSFAALLFLSYTQFFWTRTIAILPRAWNWVDDLAVLLLGILALTRMPRATGVSRAWAWCLAGFVATGLVSMVINEVPPSRAVLGFRTLLIMAPLYYASSVFLNDERDMLLVARCLAVLLLVQVPFQFAQVFMGMGAVGTEFSSGIADLGVGTFGPGMANALGLLLVPAICTGAAVGVSTGQRKYLFFALVLGIGLILSSARAALLLLPLCLIISIALADGWRSLLSLRSLIRLSVIAGAVGIAGEAYYRSTTGEGLAARFSPQRIFIEQTTYNPYSSSRLLYYPITWDVLTSDAASPFLGLGPGNYGTGAAYMTDAPGLGLIRDIFGQYQSDRETALNSDLLAVLGEYGILGLSFYLLMIAFLACRTLAVRRTLGEGAARGVLTGIFLLQFVFLVGSVVEPLWEDQPVSMTFWLASGAVARLAQITGGGTLASERSTGTPGDRSRTDRTAGSGVRLDE